jgi:hypothetical protein
MMTLGDGLHDVSFGKDATGWECWRIVSTMEYKTNPNYHTYFIFIPHKSDKESNCMHMHRFSILRVTLPSLDP